MARIEAHIGSFPDSLRSSADQLLSRHGYTTDPGNPGPHTNVLGHPLIQLPLWLAATSEEVLDPEVIEDILESSLWGYLAVRAEDDLFDGLDTDQESAVMLAAAFRTRHLALLARHISDDRFWCRVEGVWQQYANAMLVENKLNEPSSEYRPEDFDRVLLRSQPLEIPADAVLVVSNRWDKLATITRLVGHLVKATQIFDDFVDAPADLAMGNHTLIVRRLGGAMGEEVLRRNMIGMCDDVMAEASAELDRAVGASADLGLDGLVEWVDSRNREMKALPERAFRALFEKLTASSPPDTPSTA